MSTARSHACTLLRALHEAGHEAWLAGGCVRDELLGIDPKDFDVATSATPDQVQHLFPRTHAVGKSFGVVLVRHETSVIEVATFRTEGPYTDKRRPDHVSFCDAASDARRRDFTINALFLDPLAPETEWTHGARGRVIDHVGGLDDLDARVIRAVGSAADRLDEDHLRALRAVRFAARFEFAIEPATADAIRADAASLQGVSRERIGDELRRMLLHPTSGEALTLMESLGLAAAALDEPASAPVELPTVRALPARSAAPTSDIEAAEIAVQLCAWALDRGASPVDGGFVTRWRRALCLSNEETDAMREILRLTHALESEWASASEAQRKRLAARDLSAWSLRLVEARSPEVADALRRTIQMLADSSTGLSPTPLVTGDDLIEAGMRPGPRFKAILDEVYDAQLDGRIRTREDAITLARTMAS